MNSKLMRAAACIALALVLPGLGSTAAAAAQDSTKHVTADAATGKVKRTPVAGFEDIDPDARLRPQDDFYEFVNRGWLTRSEIPADRSAWGAFHELDEQAELQVREIIASVVATRDKPSHPDLAKVADLYLSFMDEEAIESAGLEPIAPWLARIDAIEDHEALAAAFGTVRRRASSSRCRSATGSTSTSRTRSAMACMSRSPGSACRIATTTCSMTRR